MGEENAITFVKLWIMKDISVGLLNVPWGLFHLQHCLGPSATSCWNDLLFNPVLAAVIWLFLLNPLGLSHDKHELWPLCSLPRWFGFFNFFLFNIFALFPCLFFPFCSLFYFLPRQGLLWGLGSILVFFLKYNTDAEKQTN